MSVKHLLRLSRFESYHRHILILENKSARRGDRLLNGWVEENLAVVRVHCFPQKVVVRDGVTSVNSTMN
jgi:hypothetical protein